MLSSHSLANMRLLLPMWLLLPGALSGSPGTGHFEPWLEELWAAEGHPRSLRAGLPLELRIAKGLGQKGYNKVRVSLISDKLEEFTDFNFTYRSQFKYRWTENFLHSSLLELQPGPNQLSIGGETVVIDLPADDAGIRGVFWSDPCFSSKWITCAYADRFQTFNRSIGMLNAVYADPSMTFFSMLGDNFYDQTGELTKTFFPRLSSDLKRRFMFIANGNHDNWVCGSPECGDQNDNFGLGQMQYYASDSVSSLLPTHSDVDFIDLSIDPDERRQYQTWQNAGTNFLVYHKLGNIGFLGFSGASNFDEMRPHFQEACSYFDESNPAAIFVLGHWNSDGMGCAHNMSVPVVRRELLSMPGCTRFAGRLKYMDGHEHCNYVQASGSEAYGFMIGAHGMDDAMCQPQYGFLFLDSTGGRVRLHYFEVDSDQKGDRYDAIVNCVATKGGLANCTEFADTWLDVPTAHLVERAVEVI